MAAKRTRFWKQVLFNFIPNGGLLRNKYNSALTLKALVIDREQVCKELKVRERLVTF